LDTNGAGALFLSTNDNPANKIKISDAINTQSNTITLQNNTKYKRKKNISRISKIISI
jgi:hypothetical protein